MQIVTVIFSITKHHERCHFYHRSRSCLTAQSQLKAGTDFRTNTGSSGTVLA